MKHLFILNPAAGKQDRTAALTAMIQHKFAGRDYEIQISRAPGDCRAIAYAAAARGDSVRLYACGGDGTLNEVVDGAADFPNASVTCFPVGSGNDFIRIFSDPGAFFDLDRLLDCETAKFDLIRCNNHYSLNICSVGLDARIGTAIARYKRLPFVSGSGAYLLSTIVNVLRGVHRPLSLKIDGQPFSGRYTLVCICNGRFYGGGFHPVPDAEPDDGLLDVLLIDSVSRLTVATVISRYKAGRYRDFPSLIHHFRCKTMEIHSENLLSVNLDGELLRTNTVEIQVCPAQISFFYPRGLQYHTSAPQIVSNSV